MPIYEIVYHTFEEVANVFRVFSAFRVSFRLMHSGRIVAQPERDSRENGDFNVSFGYVTWCDGS